MFSIRVSCRLVNKNLHNKTKIYRRYSSSFEGSYTIKEIRIPSPEGHLAGKLWEGTGMPSTSESSKPLPIICMHGYLDNAGSFDPLIPLLTKPNSTYFAMDFPGHGFSSSTKRPQANLFIDGFLGVHRTMRYFGWEKVTLLTHSLGAAAGYIMSSTFPEHVDRLICMDNYHPVPREIQFYTRIMTDGVFDVEKIESKKSSPPSYPYEEILQRFYDARGGTITMEGCKILLKRGTLELPNGKFSFGHDIRCVQVPGIGWFSKEQTNFMGTQIKCPVCVIKTEKGASHYEPVEAFIESLEFTRKNSPKVEFHLVPGTHHFHLNEPEVAAGIINSFLSS